MAKRQAKAAEAAAAVETVDEQAEARTALDEAIADSGKSVAELEAALAEAKAEHEGNVAARAELDKPAPIVGPRVYLENVSAFHAVEPDEARSYRLLIGGFNYEHVGEVVDQGEVIWVYRRM